MEEWVEILENARRLTPTKTPDLTSPRSITPPPSQAISVAFSAPSSAVGSNGSLTDSPVVATSAPEESFIDPSISQQLQLSPDSPSQNTSTSSTSPLQATPQSLSDSTPDWARNFLFL